MPGSVANAAPTLVMPRVLCRAFQPSREWWCEVNVYRNGERQARARVTAPRRAWRLSTAVTAAEWAALMSFIEDVRFGLEPFFYYDPFEPASGQAVGSNFDATGVSTQGRYTVVLRGGVEAELNLPRGAMSLELVEVA